MGILNKHYAKQDFIQLYVVCAFPIHILAIFNMLHDVPVMILYVTSEEIVGSWAYNMAFTPLETIIVLLFVLAIGIALSIRLDTTTYVTLSSIILTETALIRLLFELLTNYSSLMSFLTTTSPIVFALIVLLMPEKPKWKDITYSIATRLAVLTFIYILINVVGVITVIVRLV